MHWVLLLTCILFSAPPLQSKEQEIRLGVNGNIQFGPFKHSLRPYVPEPHLFVRSNTSNHDRKHKKSKKNTETTPVENKVSQLHGVRKFIVLIYKKNIEIFEDIKRKIHPPLRTHIDAIKKEYTEKFIEFVNTTQHHNVKTKSGSHKVIINTINTSDNIVRRLLTHLVQYMNDRGILRSSMDETDRLFGTELDKEKQRQYQNACGKLNICKVSQDFSRFNIDIFDKIIRCDNAKVKQAMDSLIESIKETDFTRIIGNKGKKLQKILENVERSPPDVMRTRFFLYKNVIKNRYKPLTIFKDSDKTTVNRTVAYTDLIELMDKKMPSNRNLTIEMEYLMQRVGQWANDFSTEIQDPMRTFVKIYFDIYKHADYKTQKSMKQYFKKLLS